MNSGWVVALGWGGREGKSALRVKTKWRLTAASAERG